MFAARNMLFAGVVPFVEGWEASVAVSTIGDSIVSTEGTLVIAENYGSGSSATVNGVVFAVRNPNPTNWTSFTSSNIYSDGVIGAAFETMMDSFIYHTTTSGSITYSGLEVGKQYIAQVFISDDRNAETRARTTVPTMAGFVGSATTNGTSYSRILRFLATSTSHILTITQSGGNSSINGFQLRKLN